MKKARSKNKSSAAQKPFGNKQETHVSKLCPKLLAVWSSNTTAPERPKLVVSYQRVSRDILQLKVYNWPQFSWKKILQDYFLIY